MILFWTSKRHLNGLFERSSWLQTVNLPGTMAPGELLAIVDPPK